MNNYLALYLFTRLDIFYGCAIGGVVISLFAAGIYYGVKMTECYDIEDRKEYDVNHKTVRKSIFAIFIISSFLMIFMPSQKDVIIIIAGGKTLEYVQSDTSLAKIPYQTTELITKYLDEQIGKFNTPKK